MLVRNIIPRSIVATKRHSPHLVAFSDFKFIQTGYTTVQARILETFNIGLCCVPITRAQDSNNKITIRVPNATSFSVVILLMLLDSAESAHGHDRLEK